MRPMLLPAAAGLLVVLTGALILQNRGLRRELSETQRVTQLPEIFGGRCSVRNG